MRKPRSQGRLNAWTLLSCLVGFWVMGGCAALSSAKQAPIESRVPVVESVKVSPLQDQTIIEITNSQKSPFTAFKLVDPERIIIDIRAKAADDLPELTEVNNEYVKTIRFEQGKTQAVTTRATIELPRTLDHKIKGTDRIIRISLMPKQVMKKTPASAETEISPEVEKAEEKPVVPSEPRVFVKPEPSDQNQVLGIDFTMMDKGKSRVIITTNKRVGYDLDRKGQQTLILKLPQTTVATQLLRLIDASQFHGAVDQIIPAYLAAEKEITIAIALKEMVPYHVKQTDETITIDFGPSSIKPPEKLLVPVQLTQPKTEAPAAMLAETPTAARAEASESPSAPAVAEQVPPREEAVQIPGISRKQYTGTPMTMDFLNADVTNILRLIGEVSQLNIIWGPEVRGNVSMRLKNVPWDQALDVILENNNLRQRKVGNVIWITTKAKMAQVEAEERRRIEEYRARLEAERRKRAEEAEKKKQLEPVETEYIPVDFAAADDIKDHIVVSNRGKVSIDERTNTIIMVDIRSSINEARKTVKHFDTPVKQVMIEARIVDATDEFTRSLGVQWDFDHQQVNNKNVTWSGAPAWAPNNTAGDFPDGGNRYTPTFNTALAAGATALSGLVFTKLGGFGLRGTSIDAKIALAETRGITKIISAPKIVASNGEEAVISRGQSRIIAATENVEAATLDATLSLTVTPTVSFNNYVTMDIAVTDDTSPDTTLINRKSVDTKLMVRSGETVVIGGIYKQDYSLNKAAVPGLSKIPLIGWMFRSQHKDDEKTELLIFLTPTVLPPSVSSR